MKRFSCSKCSQTFAHRQSRNRHLKGLCSTRSTMNYIFDLLDKDVVTANSAVQVTTTAPESATAEMGAARLGIPQLSAGSSLVDNLGLGQDESTVATSNSRLPMESPARPFSPVSENEDGRQGLPAPPKSRKRKLGGHNTRDEDLERKISNNHQALTQKVEALPNIMRDLVDDALQRQLEYQRQLVSVVHKDTQKIIRLLKCNQLSQGKVVSDELLKSVVNLNKVVAEGLKPQTAKNQ